MPRWWLTLIFVIFAMDFYADIPWLIRVVIWIYTYIYYNTSKFFGNKKMTATCVVLQQLDTNFINFNPRTIKNRNSFSVLSYFEQCLLYLSWLGIFPLEDLNFTHPGTHFESTERTHRTHTHIICWYFIRDTIGMYDKPFYQLLVHYNLET